jgi:hypothetical protein
MQAQSGQWQVTLQRHCTQFSIQYRTQLYKNGNYNGVNSSRYDVLYIHTFITVYNLWLLIQEAADGASVTKGWSHIQNQKQSHVSVSFSIVFVQRNMKTSWDTELFWYWRLIRIVLTRIPRMDRAKLQTRVKISACVMQFKRRNILINA